ncbi:ExbD/TolR family protein [Marinibacterium sp. SX1]|uniref:ExbD/TolR family protein n=1 Tax=Marinibacterium sp. SX1 TaxID=3388424 RepID=UPI003D1845F5
MNFRNAHHRRRSGRTDRSEAGLTPMIDVVFMLLIFFMMISQVTPPEPFDVTLPTVPEAGEPQADGRLYVDRAGLTGYDGVTGQAALDRLQELHSRDEPLQIRADAGVEATTLARLLGEISARGVTRVEVMVGQ